MRCSAFAISLSCLRWSRSFERAKNSGRVSFQPVLSRTADYGCHWVFVRFGKQKDTFLTCLHVLWRWAMQKKLVARGDTLFLCVFSDALQDVLPACLLASVFWRWHRGRTTWVVPDMPIPAAWLYRQKFFVRVLRKAVPATNPSSESSYWKRFVAKNAPIILTSGTPAPVAAFAVTHRIVKILSERYARMRGGAEQKWRRIFVAVVLSSCCRSGVFPLRLKAGRRPEIISMDTSPPLPPETKDVMSNRIVLIGRGPGNDIVLRDQSVSLQHARIVVGEDGLVLEDLGSRNGTFVGAPPQRITSATISLDDPLTFGRALLPANVLRDFLERTRSPRQLKKSIHLEDQALVTFGRGNEAQVAIEEPVVSLLHASVSLEGGTVLVRDLGSMTGTFVDGRRIQGEAEIHPGSLLQIADQRYRLSDGGDSLEAVHGAATAIEAVGVEISAGTGRRKKCLIEDVSLVIEPGELVAVMGPSGAGKSTLLSIVNGQAIPSKGQVIIGGLDLHDHFDLFRGRIGFVPQDDILHADLTVWQALWYAARLRLPADTTAEEIATRIRDVIAQLGLEGTENTRIGDQRKRGISGGQRKRVNLAMELLTDPPILILDEPTSGLSSTDTLAVIELLRRLANSGKTIIVTIHQPSLDAYRLFDAVAIIARDSSTGQVGRLAYFGRAWPDAVTFFEPSSEESAVPTNVDGLLRGLATKSVLSWVAQWEASPIRSIWVEGRAGVHPPNKGHHARLRPRPVAKMMQWKTLVQRNIAVKVADRWNTLVLFLQAPLIAGLIAAVFSKVLRGNPTPDTWARSGLDMATTMFVMALAAIWFGCSGTAREIVNEWPVYRRERMVGLSLLSYVGSKLAILAILTAIQTTMLIAIVGWGCNLEGPIWHHWVILELAALSGGAVGLVISASLSTPEAAAGVLPVLLLPMIVLGGILVPIADLPKSVQPAAAVMPSRWAFEGLVVPEALARPRMRIPNIPQAVPAKRPMRPASTTKKPSPFQFVSAKRNHFLLPGRRRIAEELTKAAKQAEQQLKEAKENADRKAKAVEEKVRQDVERKAQEMQDAIDQAKADFERKAAEMNQQMEAKVKAELEKANIEIESRMETMKEQLEKEQREIEQTLSQLGGPAGLKLIPADAEKKASDVDMAEQFFPKHQKRSIRGVPLAVLSSLFCLGVAITGIVLIRRDTVGR